MYTQNELQQFISFDIETVSSHKSLNELEVDNPRLGQLWRKRCVYLRNKHADNLNLSDEEIFSQKAGLQAEFGKIVCISISYVRFDKETSTPTIKTKSFANDDETLILKPFLNFIRKVQVDMPNSILVGHNIKRFDVPYIFKRSLINGLEVPDMLKTNGKKPWEMKLTDTAELWSGGSWQESFTSLDIMTTVLGLPTPKSEMDGSEVTDAYWNKGKLNEIAQYCERDVASVLNFLLRISNLPHVNLVDVVTT